MRNDPTNTTRAQVRHTVLEASSISRDTALPEAPLQQRARVGSGADPAPPDPGGSDQHLSGSSGTLALGSQLHPFPQ